MVRNSKITRRAIKTVAPARFTHKALSEGTPFYLILTYAALEIKASLARVFKKMARTLFLRLLALLVKQFLDLC